MRRDEFRDVLDEALGPEPQPSDATRRAIHRRVGRRRTQRWVMASAAIVIVVGTAVAVVLWPRPPGHTTLAVNPHNNTTAPASNTGPGWRRVPNPPYPNALAAVRSGDEAVVAFSLPEGLRFASFDPVAQRWDTLPTPPLDLQAPYTDSPTFANVGDSIIVWGHAQKVAGDTSAGSMRIMEYEPRTRTWQVLPDSPIRTLIQATPIWTGSELIAWGGNVGGPNVAAAFDPMRRQWHLLPPGPLHPREDPVVVWTGREMLVWGGFAYPAGGAEGAALNPRTDAWRILPSSGLSTRELAATAWTGRLLVVWGGSGGGNVPEPHDGASYDPATNQWHPIAAAPIKGRHLAAVTWTGQDLFIWGGQSFESGRQTLQDGATYNPTTNRWNVLPRAPLVSRWGAATVWTGNEALVIEGYGPSRPGLPMEPALADAAIYRPK